MSTFTTAGTDKGVCMSVSSCRLLLLVQDNDAHIYVCFFPVFGIVGCLITL
jgi:hypothetical protein